MSDYADEDLISDSGPPRIWLFPYSLLVFVPLSIVLNLLHVNPVLVLVSVILAIIPVTSLLARSAQELSLRTSTVVSSLLNATFGNAIEFMIALFALKAGLMDMVKASIIGSIVLNLLSITGFSMIFGGIRHREQMFNKDSVGVASTMLLIAVAGLSVPTIHSVVAQKSLNIMSDAVAITLGVTYLLSLVFILVTHRHLFDARRDVSEEIRWGLGRALLGLGLATVLAGVEAQILVGVLQPIVATTGLHEVFVGLVLIAVITNIPEHLTAIKFGLRGDITQSLEIGMNSAIQIALFVVPILVLISPLVGAQLTLAFNPFQMIAMILAVMIINYIGSDGTCNWLEGVQLVAVYVIIAVAFYFT